MTLYVVRHGIAEDTAPGGDDRARRLTARGRVRMRAAAVGMRRLGIQFDVLLTSPLVRARETAEIVSTAYEEVVKPRELPALAQGVAPAETVQGLRPLARSQAVMIVGHEPGLSGMVSLLLTGSTEGMRLVIKKGGLVKLALDAVAPHKAVLRYMLTARQLRMIAK